ncbi:hypothetical protein PRZ48_010535 [Zasmidium cellare]|uniref:Dimethyladenosine transferase n=1 Tax=Zasmidium cellare TaxID=395010 RepID=A0ABR0E933_ZASCE|nr:hypothetical protein PRZ48_010535 [Zasmidium cellare]
MEAPILSPQSVEDSINQAVKFIPADKIDETFKSDSIDLINKPLGSRILSFSDEWFAAAENLTTPTPPIRKPGVFTFAGAWYDGWETRRHNQDPFDWVVLRLGVASGKVKGFEVDTAFFNGNHAPEVAVQACFISDDREEEVKKKDFGEWETILPKQECGPSQRHGWLLPKITDKAYTHVRLQMFPDGGIARFRLFGEALPVLPQDVNEVFDLAATVNGGVAVKCSDQHFGTKDNLLLPGRGVDMGDGWETKRSRGVHIDWVIIKLGTPGLVTKLVVDTAHFRGNFPQKVQIFAAPKADKAPEHEDLVWEEILSPQKTGPDQEHEYAGEVIKEAEGKVFGFVKLVIIPDGGVKRRQAATKISGPSLNFTSDFLELNLTSNTPTHTTATMPKSARKPSNGISKPDPYAGAAARKGKSSQANNIFRMNTDIGQHILKNPGVAQAIVDKADVKQSDIVLEVGPGTGNLTTRILEKAKRVIAVEQDPRMAAELTKRFQGTPAAKRLELILGDVIKMEKLPYFDICISNTPYQISSPLTFKLLATSPAPRTCVLMFQREFAMRLFAKPGDKLYSRLSVNAQMWAKVDHVMKVGRNNFNPPPQVESNVVRISPKTPRPQVSYEEWDGLLRVCFVRKNRVLRSGFLGTASVMAMLEANYRTFCAQNEIVLDDGPLEGGEGMDVDEEVQEDDGAMLMDEDDEDVPDFFKEERDKQAKKLLDDPGRKKKGKVAELVRSKVKKVLEVDTELAEKRARLCDEGDFLKLLYAFNQEGIHFA